MLEPEIKMLTPKKLAGMHVTMSLAANRTGELWQRFMPRRRDVTRAVGTDLYSLAVYPWPVDFTDRRKEFEKWAAVEVTDFDALPDGMEALTLPGGLYAVFHYKGSSAGIGIFQYIFGAWLPANASTYRLDDRPHFEVLGSKYKNNDPESEEDIWIPIKTNTGS